MSNAEICTCEYFPHCQDVICMTCGKSQKHAGEVLRQLMAENEQLWAEKAELCDALEELMDWQNGPPLSSAKWVEGWGNAMAEAERLLVVHGRTEVTP